MTFWWQCMERYMDYRTMYVKASMFYPDKESAHFQEIAEAI